MAAKLQEERRGGLEGWGVNEGEGTGGKGGGERNRERGINKGVGVGVRMGEREKPSPSSDNFDYCDLHGIIATYLLCHKVPRRLFFL